MKQTLLALAVVFAGTLGALAQKDGAAPLPERRLKVQFIERINPLLIDKTTVIIADEEHRRPASGLAKALRVKRVLTLHEYIQNLQDGDRANGGIPLDYQKIRREIERDLEGNDAVIYRYVSKE